MLCTCVSCVQLLLFDRLPEHFGKHDQAADDKVWNEPLTKDARLIEFLVQYVQSHHHARIFFKILKLKNMEIKTEKEKREREENTGEKGHRAQRKQQLRKQQLRKQQLRKQHILFLHIVDRWGSWHHAHRHSTTSNIPTQK